MKKRTFLKTTGLIAGSSIAIPSLILDACAPKTQDENNTSEETVQKASFTLPDLPYEFAALTPFIDAMTMEIHHDRHHQGYVNKLNAALDSFNGTYNSLDDLLAMDNLPDGVRNNGGGHYNHSLFWTSLKAGGSEPTSAFLDKVNSDFGSMDELKKQLINGGGSVFGSGWVWLISNNGKLEVTTTPNQDNPLMVYADTKGKPLLGIDVWEHAYYLNYQNKRGEYLENIFNVINWEEVSKRWG